MKAPILKTVRRISIAALGALMATGCTSGSLSSGIAAFTVNGHEVSQRSVDDELEVIAESEALNELVFESSQGQGQIAQTPGSITAANASAWLSLGIAQEVARQEVERRDVRVTDADRELGAEIASQNLGGAQVFGTLPIWFQRRLSDRWSDVVALQRVLLASSTDIEQLVRELCPSGRYLNVILVETQAEADALAAQLGAGADFAQVASQSSIDASGAEGGALGCVDGQQLPEAIEAAAATQAPGAISAPIALEQGFLLLQVSSTAPLGTAEQIALEEVLGRARAADVTVDPRYGTWKPKQGQVAPHQLPAAATSS